MRSAMKNLQWYLLGLHDSKATSEECKQLLSMILDRIADVYIKQEVEFAKQHQEFGYANGCNDTHYRSEEEHEVDDYNFYPDTDL